MHFREIPGTIIIILCWHETSSYDQDLLAKVRNILSKMLNSLIILVIIIRSFATNIFP